MLKTAPGINSTAKQVLDKIREELGKELLAYGIPIATNLNSRIL